MAAAGAGGGVVGDRVMAVRAAIAGLEGKGRSVPESEIIHYKPAEGAFPVIFFDNDIVKLAQVFQFCKHIELVRVGESAIHATNPSAINGDYAPLWDDHNISANAYTQLSAVRPSGHMFFDIYSGMQKREYEIIDSWVRRSAALAPRTAVFDWDRTLTMVEGIRLGHVPNSTIRDAIASQYPGLVPANYVEDMLIYLCGGPARLITLRAMFTYLRANGVNIRILTNNPAAGHPASAPLFKELVNALVAIPGYDVQVVCSHFGDPPSSDPLGPYAGDKGWFMRKMFPELCGMAGGRRRRRLKTIKVVRRRGRKSRRLR